MDGIGGTDLALRRSSSGLRHYVVQTTDPSVATTKIAVAELMGEGFPTLWLATQETYTDRFRRTRTLDESLFPGYLFVQVNIDVEAWKYIPQLRGVRRILGSSPTKPVAMPLGAIDRLRAEFDAGEFKVKSPLPIVAGDMIRVDVGWLAGKSGVCKMSKGERIEVMMAEFAGKVVLHRGMVSRAVA